ncbi:MAG: hypothetical protein ACPGRD_07330, partial [Planktomarina sp.]
MVRLWFFVLGISALGVGVPAMAKDPSNLSIATVQAPPHFQKYLQHFGGTLDGITFDQGWVDLETAEILVVFQKYSDQTAFVPEEYQQGYSIFKQHRKSHQFEAHPTFAGGG